MSNLLSKRFSLFSVLVGLCVCALALHHTSRIVGISLAGGAVLSATVFGFLIVPISRPEKLAPLVAIVGCDGAGKSTLAADMLRLFGRQGDVATCYLGLGSGEMGERIKRWPLIGRAIEAKLASKAAQARTKDEKIPGILTALVIFGFSLLRRRRFRRMLALRRRGVAMITDRYPQTEVAGFYDGPGLSAGRAGGRIVAWLARRERSMYEAMAAHRPDLVIRLNIDADTAHARKPEHQFASLQAKVAVTPTLRFNGARIVDLDARTPYADIRGEAVALIQQVLDRADRRALSAA